jgi:hypothetical protein
VSDDVLQWVRDFEVAALRERANKLEAILAAKASDVELRKRAAEKIANGSNLTRTEAAAHLGVDPKTLQRMEADGTLRRCPGLRGAVRYAARDVQRLASAPGKER